MLDATATGRSFTVVGAPTWLVDLATHLDMPPPRLTATVAEAVSALRLHVGRPVRTQHEVRRYVSVWLRGVRYCGWLVAGEPGNGDGPDQAP
jgi:hypothetical protein